MVSPELPEKPTQRYFWHDLAQRVRIEWLGTTLVLSALTMLLGLFSHSIGFARLDYTFYDTLLTTTTGQPANPDIVIVAIDDASISQLGYWPWRRQVHATLLGRLQGAKAVGLDIAFTDPNPAYPHDDKKLAWSVAKQGHVVLPLLIGPHGQVIRPIAPLDTAARALGYINIVPDDDGVIRSVQLEQHLPDGKQVEHFALAMLDAAGQTAQAARIKHQVGTSSVLIPYAGSAGHFVMYPYAAVLHGQITPSAFKDKLVLVGAWGTGLGDTFPTPVTQNGKPMAGVEILANILQGALSNNWIHTLAPWLAALLGALPVFILCLLLRHLSPSQCFVAAVVVAALVFVVDGLLLHFAHIWIAPTASLAGVILAGPVWSWRTQQATLRHIDHELQTLQQEQEQDQQRRQQGRKNQPARALRATVSWLRDRSLAARVIALHNAIDQVRHLRKQETKARKQRDETLRFISHDMRSPQNSILALTSLQATPDARLPESELLQRIDHYAGKTLSLVDGFLLLARAESMTMHRRVINLTDLIDRVRDDYWALAKEQHIVIDVNHANATALIQGDEATLVRAIGNLVDNAIKYSGADTHIVFTLTLQGATWQIKLSDQGRGIDEDDLTHIFMPFSRVNEHAAGNPAGSGLGLAFVKTIIERHDGAISASSKIGVGTTFVIDLPAADTRTSLGQAG